MTVAWRGQPFPLGATWDGQGTNFSVFSEHAEAVELCLFDDEDREHTECVIWPAPTAVDVMMSAPR